MAFKMKGSAFKLNNVATKSVLKQRTRKEQLLASKEKIDNMSRKERREALKEEKIHDISQRVNPKKYQPIGGGKSKRVPGRLASKKRKEDYLLNKSLRRVSGDVEAIDRDVLEGLGGDKYTGVE